MRNHDDKGLNSPGLPWNKHYAFGGRGIISKSDKINIDPYVNHEIDSSPLNKVIEHNKSDKEDLNYEESDEEDTQKLTHHFGGDAIQDNHELLFIGSDEHDSPDLRNKKKKTNSKTKLSQKGVRQLKRKEPAVALII